MKKFIGILPTLQLNDALVARQLAVHPSRSLGNDPADVPHGLYYLDDDRLTPLFDFYSYNPQPAPPQASMSYTEDKLRDSRDESYETPEAHNMSVGRYIATRIPTLKPPMNKAPNPFKLLALLNFQQWMFFLVGFLGWSWDAFDFFTVSLTVTQLAKQFGKSNSQITWGITLVLMFRSVGSVIFGMASAISTIQ